MVRTFDGGPALRVEAAWVSFGERRALTDLSLCVERGERVALIGASGAGKSTLLGLLTRSVALSAGRVEVHGEELGALAPRALRAARRRVGIVYQAYGLVPQLSAGMNVALGELAGGSARAALRAFVRGPRPQLSARAGEALERVGLGDRIADRVSELSGGEQQRVAVARLLVQRPRLVLADEPVSAVDRVTGARVLAALTEVADSGATLLVALHDVAVARRFPRVVALREGAVVFDGPPAELDDDRLAEVYAGDPLDVAPAVVAGGGGATRPWTADGLTLVHDSEGYGLRAR